MNTEQIMDRIAKLMAKAKGTNNENEAAIFAEKAAELLAEHNLTEEMLRHRDADREQGPIGGHPYAGRVPDQWRQWILNGCSKLYFCQLIMTGRGKKTYTFYGREHNAKVASMMSDYLFATVKRMAREYSPVKAEQNDFRKGAGLRLNQRLRELHDLQNPPQPVGASNPDGLPALYANEARAVDSYIAELFPNLRTGKSRPARMGAGAQAGRAAADRIGLNTQVRETRANRMLGA